MSDVSEASGITAPHKPGLCDHGDCPNEWTHVAYQKGGAPIRRCKEHRAARAEVLSLSAVPEGIRAR